MQLAVGDAASTGNPGQAAGVTIGPFRVGVDGRLRPRVPGLAGRLRFDWRARRVEAELDEDRLRLWALSGRVPSTAARPAQREPAFALLRALPGCLPEGWRLSLLPDHRVMLESEERLPSPTAATLLARLTLFALALAPYFDVLEEAGVTPGAAGETEPGTAKI